MVVPDPQTARTCPNDKRELTYEELIARRGNTFVFLDDIFTYGDGPVGVGDDTPLRGATTTRMCPVSQEEIDRRMDRLRDYEGSRLAHIYDETDTPQGWDEWIEGQIRRDGVRLVYDPSYEGKYGEKVRELAKEELGYEDVAVVECVGGGRAFNEAEQEYDTVYNEELMKAMRASEKADMAGRFWRKVREKAEA